MMTHPNNIGVYGDLKIEDALAAVYRCGIEFWTEVREPATMIEFQTYPAYFEFRLRWHGQVPLVDHEFQAGLGYVVEIEGEVPDAVADWLSTMYPSSTYPGHHRLIPITALNFRTASHKRLFEREVGMT